jgi:methyltransferase-like protein
MKDRHTVDYADLPYPNKTQPERHVYNLNLRSRLFGLTPAPPENCRMLDLACSNARQIIAMAYEFPNSEFVGIDSSASAIADGQRLAKDLDLRNIRLICDDIKGLASELGSFDYITVHGAFTWVPVKLQKRILRIAQTHLAEDGVFLLHYRSYPGSFSYEALRRLFCIHIDGLKDTKARLSRAYELVDFLHEALPPYHPLRPEVEEVYGYKGDETLESLFYHDYVAPDAQCFYFEDLAEQAKLHNLQYVCEMQPSYTWHLDLDARSERVLRRIVDPIKREQYHDYLSYNNTRYSLFCLGQTPIKQELDEEVIKECTVSANIHSDTQNLTSEDQCNQEADYFLGPSALTECIIKAIGEEWPQAISFWGLVNKVMDASITDAKDIRERSRNTIAAELVSFIRQKYETGQLHLWPVKYDFCQYVSDTPMTSELARSLAQHNKPAWIINQRYETMNLDSLQHYVLQLSDGRREIRDIVRAIQESEQIEYLQERVTSVEFEENDVHQALKYFANNALLIA